MIKKIASVCVLALALVPASWAASATWTAYTNVPYTTDSDYQEVDFSAGTVFSASVSGFGPGNGVSFAKDIYSPNYLVLISPGTGSSQSFSQSGSSSPLPANTTVACYVSATSNGAGAYCNATLTATW